MRFDARNTKFTWLAVMQAMFFISYSQSIITTVAGNGVAGYTGDGGPAVNAQIAYPRGMFHDKNGNYYFAELGNNVIRKVNMLDTITTIAGTGGPTYTYNGDGIAATSANICPINATTDLKGNFYISDQCNSRIRKVDASGIICTIAGNGTSGYTGDNGPASAAQVKGPGLIMVDRVGNLIFTDFVAHVVRKIDTFGIITTIAGTGVGGFNGDNVAATTAQLNGPYAIAEDTLGNFYVADQLNNRIRKIDKNGIISTIAGTGAAGYGGDGGVAISAILNNPAQITLDDLGNIFFADYYNRRIRKIDTSGVITTIAGTGASGYSGDGGLATAAKLTPWGIALNAAGDLFVCDESNSAIRKITNVGVMKVKSLEKPIMKLQIFPNPGSHFVTVSCPEATGATLKIFNSLGELVMAQRFVLEEKISLDKFSLGLYFVEVETPKGVARSKFIKE